MHAAQVSTDSGEYNPEIPTSTKLPTISDAEAKIRKREQLMEEHKKLQRLKSQQEEETTAVMIFCFHIILNKKNKMWSVQQHNCNLISSAIIAES
jgi:hypothetical protein